MQLEVNGSLYDVNDNSDTPLLYVLRDTLGMVGPKFGCGLAQCGACSVLVDGHAVRSCVLPAISVSGRSIVTLEGLGNADSPHRVQKAFLDLQAMQCGYCINGMIIAAVSLLRRNANPTRNEIVAALDGNLCRCGSHNRIVDAIERAAREQS